MLLDGWQEIILQAAMGERSDATWAAKRVGVSVPRQNGKSQLLVARALAGVLLFGEKKIVVSAHQADTARETFIKFMEIHDADRNGWLRDRVRPNGIMAAINREAIKFKNGATIQFKARTGAGGRGFSSDCLMLDEAQRLKRSAWVSINSTMSAMPNPQVWLLGTPPTREDDGEVFESIRKAARDGVSTAAAWVEWSADPSAPDYDPSSEYTRWQANPAWNTRINHEIVDGEYESYTEEEFALDRLGVWLAEISAGSRAIPADLWADLGVDEPPTEGSPSFAVAFSGNGMRVSLAGGLHHEGGTHVELVDAVEGSSESGLAPLADWFVEKNEAGSARWRRAAVIVLSGSAGAGVLRQMLIDRKVSPRRIVLASTAQYLQSAEMFRDATRDGSVSHLKSDGQHALDAAVAVVDRDKRGGWMSTVPDGDETPVEAVSLALWGARTFKPRSTEKPKGVIL